MRSSNKSRSRNKSNGRRTNNPGNIINRVYDSAGPEGRVRGTPQQIIDKYRGLAHDANLADDRVGAESFHQHAEHYARLLLEAQREISARQSEHQERQQNRQNVQDGDSADMSDAVMPDTSDDAGLVETPEGKAKPVRKPRKPKPVDVEIVAQENG